MKNLRININEERDARRYIARAEHDFSSKLDSAIDGVFERGAAKIIALAGPTCSGKTTTANKLVERIVADGGHAVTLSIDDFFLDRTDRNNVKAEAPDYDSVNAIDFDCLERFVGDLLAGKVVNVPRYDFETTSRAGYTEYIPQENDIYLFEGIQAVYPEITSMFGGEYRSIFISVADNVKYRGTVLDRNEIRLLRRIVRDFYFRGATAEFSLHLWQNVRSNEEKNIFPNAKNCDIYIDSFLRYEPFVLSRHAGKLLDTVPRDSRYRAYADELISKLEEFRCPLFKDEMIPADSMFREFIG